ncbi:MAG: dihydropteroate synthase, partial [Candidatus Omnitrophica bacterium]|nr:dihydropteroate synthase [Candidatus Omnitrophota bacterium]
LRRFESCPAHQAGSEHKAEKPGHRFTTHAHVDPGIGFGKSVDDNLKIINKLYIFKSLGLPIFLGISRKSFIGKILNVDIDKRLIGSISALVVSLINGANVFRVHDVEETCQTLRLVYSILRVN